MTKSRATDLCYLIGGLFLGHMLFDVSTAQPLVYFIDALGACAVCYLYAWVRDHSV
jgi:hypothetical protein